MINDSHQIYTTKIASPPKSKPLVSQPIVDALEVFGFKKWFTNRIISLPNTKLSLKLFYRDYVTYLDTETENEAAIMGRNTFSSYLNSKCQTIPKSGKLRTRRGVYFYGISVIDGQYI